MLIKKDEHPIEKLTNIHAKVYWFSKEPLKTFEEVYMKIGPQTINGRIINVTDKISMENFSPVAEHDGMLQENEIGIVRFNLTSPILNENFSDSKNYARFILVNKITHATMAAGIII